MALLNSFGIPYFGSGFINWTVITTDTIITGTYNQAYITNNVATSTAILVTLPVPATANQEIIIRRGNSGSVLIGPAPTLLNGLPTVAYCNLPIGGEARFKYQDANVGWVTDSTQLGILLPGSAGAYLADAGITKDGSNRVSAWVDQSGNSRTAVQGGATAQPLWSATSLNGHCGLTFDGGNDIITAPDGAWWDVANSSMYVCAQALATTGMDLMGHFNGATGWKFAVGATTSRELAYVENATVRTDTNGVHITGDPVLMEIHRNVASAGMAAATRYVVDGRLSATENGYGTSSNSSSGLSIGGSSAGFNGIIGIALVYPVTHTEAQRGYVRRFIKNSYDLYW